MITQLILQHTLAINQAQQFFKRLV